jgi:hypothetical protein
MVRRYDQKIDELTKDNMSLRNLLEREERTKNELLQQNEEINIQFERSEATCQRVKQEFEEVSRKTNYLLSQFDNEKNNNDRLNQNLSSEATRAQQAENEMNRL